MASKARAYVEQARADYDAYVASGEAVESSLGEHHRLQLLQMALEKLAKALLYHAEPNARYPHHVVASALNRIRSHAVAEAVGVKLSQFIRMLEAAMPILVEIEASSPSVGLDGRGLTREESERTANVEYPWQLDVNNATSWVAPVSHAFGIVSRLRYDSRSYAAVRLIDRLIGTADAVLPIP
ncbi:MAG TPA: hypothetical protein VG326_17880 [Tepidisphaeraceae bacterium]|jgi:hypothetical protein|nr:hypothetical protein [Tepidisphaeraceae bacterium]